jgi:hypothetical protein
VVAIAAAVLQENARKGWLAVAATAIVVGGARYFFQISAVQAKAESDKVAAAAAKEKVNATAAAAKLQAAADEVAAAAAKAAAYAAEEALNYDHEPAPAGAATQPVLEQSVPPPPCG